ncbi:hypothetical protein KBX08_17745 [Micromonospora sp. H61]|uniref:hypothetical protein n=1 Tax=Micromonospora sp. H61 TaxID=2824888 RepID=UPI001B36BE76|nr:hypothetical protein [Micromonospora sp. H61]MBQ0991924.1 hypothetical protein [Micromonospora sp. H61]
MRVRAFGPGPPTRSSSRQVKACVRRQMEALARDGSVAKIKGERGGASGSTADRFQYIREPGEAAR